MDNESSEKIIRDAIQLCSEAIRTRNDSSLSGGLRNIAREKSPPSWLSPDTLVYEEIETPRYLKSLSIITIISTGTLILEVNRNLRGYYSVLFDYRKAEEWLRVTLNSRISKIEGHSDDKSFFGFEGKNFKIKISSGELKSINFHSSRKAGNLDTYYLMLSYVEYIKNFGNSDSGWLKVFVPKEYIKNYLKKEYKLEADDSWIRFTRRNLAGRLKSDEKLIVDIGYYDYKNKGYSFKLKKPSV